MRAVFPDATVETEELEEERHISKENAEAWYDASYSKYGLERESFLSSFSNRSVKWKTTVALVRSNTRTLKAAEGNQHREVEKLTGKEK